MLKRVELSGERTPVTGTVGRRRFTVISKILIPIATTGEVEAHYGINSDARRDELKIYMYI